MLLNNSPPLRNLMSNDKRRNPMKQAFLLTAFAAFMALPAHAACYADYQAKTDDPLRLHYGVIQLSDAACSSASRAQSEAESRLRQGGWTLLRILSTFGDEGLGSRRADAGQNYLRF